MVEIPEIRTNLGFVCVLVLAGALAGCTTFESVPVEQEIIEAGNEVRIRTRSGETLEFEVVSSESGYILGADQRIAHADIETLEVRRFNKRALYIALGAIGGGILLIREGDDDFCTSFDDCDSDFIF